MIPADLFRLWERQRELARERERERRVRAMLDAANERVLRSLAILSLR